MLKRPFVPSQQGTADKTMQGSSSTATTSNMVPSMVALAALVLAAARMVVLPITDAASYHGAATAETVPYIVRMDGRRRRQEEQQQLIQLPSRRQQQDNNGNINQADAADGAADLAPYPVGTDVWWEFDDEWYEGTIMAFHASVPSYTIRWEDGVVLDYGDMEKVNEMVQYANERRTTYADLTDYQSYPLQTPVLLEFSSGWYEGFIVDFTLVNTTFAQYEIQWSDGDQGIYSDLALVDQMVRSAKDYVSWPLGTVVYNDQEHNDGDGVAANQYGTITAFVNGHYTIEWDDGQLKDYFDFDTVAILVTLALRQDGSPSTTSSTMDDGYVPWELGTPVRYEFDDGWWKGTISDYDAIEKTYDITWDDESVSTYTDLEKVDEMVAYAKEKEVNDDNYQDYEIGTSVYKEFGDGWWVGNIVAYQGGHYTVRWVDNSYDNFEASSEELSQMVADAENIPDDAELHVHPIGTPVYREFDGIWYHGTIDSFYQSMYAVKWEDGTYTEHVQGPEMDAMVAAAAPSSEGISPAGKGVMSLFVVCAGGLLISYGIKRSLQRSTMVKEQSKTSVQELEEFDRKYNGYLS